MNEGNGVGSGGGVGGDRRSLVSRFSDAEAKGRERSESYSLFFRVFGRWQPKQAKDR